MGVKIFFCFFFFTREFILFYFFSIIGKFMQIRSRVNFIPHGARLSTEKAFYQTLSHTSVLERFRFFIFSSALTKTLLTT